MIEKVFKKVSRIAKDKLMHFTAGMLFFLVFYLFFNLGYSLIGVFIIGVLKELYDKFHKGHSVEFKDFLATSLGGLIVYLLLVLRG
jgi:hypothetical protein